MPARIKGLDDNAQVVHIGDFFRYSKNPDWSLTLWCQPIQRKKSTRLSNLPLLSRGKYLNSTTSRASRPDRVIELTPGYQLEPTTLAAFVGLSRFESVREKESAQNAFRIDTDTAANIIVPQLELARAIFLMNSYLCRACLNTATLLLEFDVQPVLAINHIDIHVLQTSTFPNGAFDQSGTRNLLAWLLTAPSAMASYKSIYRHYMTNRQFQGPLETWRFSFDPPPMINWEFHVKGRYSPDAQCYLVEEVTGVVMDIDMPDSIAFIHPDFAKRDVDTGSVRRGSGGLNWKNSGDEFEIDDEHHATDQNATLVLEGGLSWVKFTKPVEVYKQNQMRESSKLIVDELSEKEGGRQVTTDEPYQGGTLPAADVGGKQDITDRDRQFASRFLSFDHMLQVLVVKHRCLILHQETLQLPKVGRSRQHLLVDGSIRAIKAVRLLHNSCETVLLEVDTSDGLKMLSTKVIYGFDPLDWNESFYQIRKGLVSNSLAWPTMLFDRFFGPNGHVGVNHPKHQGSEVGNIPIDAIEKWAARIIKYFIC